MFTDWELRKEIAEFNPLTNISDRKAWSGCKRQEAVVNLLEGIRDGVDSARFGAACFIKSGEQVKLDSPYMDLDEDNRTSDVRARPRLVQPNYGEGGLIWLQ